MYKEKQSVIYIDGKQELKFESVSPFYNVLKGFHGQNFSFLLGQEPDKFNGGFNQAQSIRGRISELNLWDFKMSEDQMRSLAKCNASIKGNILSWEKSLITLYGTKFIDIDYLDFCRPIEKLVPVFNRVSFKEAKDFCNVHSGHLYTPTSEMSNKMLLKMFENRTSECMQETTNRIAWLGLEENDKFWKYPNNNSAVGYLNNLDTLRKSNLCTFLRASSNWEARAYSDCIKSRVCFVCQFDKEPLYTVTGFCINSDYDFNFYLNPQKNGLIEYVGYKAARIWSEGSVWHLGEIGNDISNLTSTLEKTFSHPLGRNIWMAKDSICHQDVKSQQLTISDCKMGEKFTCNSGHCIDLPRRCDSIKDCMDSSDEDNCTLIHTDINYEPLESPDIPGKFNPLWTQVNIIQFDDIDTLKMQLTLTMDIQIQWIDHRIYFSNLKHSDMEQEMTEINGRFKKKVKKEKIFTIFI